MKRICVLVGLVSSVLFVATSRVADSSQMLVNPKYITLTDAGVTMRGCIYTYEAGTTTKKTTYSDKTLTTANTNPIQCDSRGECGPIYFEGLLKVVMTNPDASGTCPSNPDNVEYTVDNIEGAGSSILDFQTCSDFTDLATAVATIDTTETTLYIDCDATLTENLTIPSNIHVVFLKGKKVTTGSYTLTINGPVTADRFQIFDTSGGGSVTFGTGAVDEVYPEWWGADNTGTTDSVAAINAALRSADSSLTPVVLQEGSYLIAAEPIVIKSRQKLRGAGAQTLLIADSGLATAVIRTYQFSTLTGTNKWLVSDGVVYGFELRDFMITGEASNTANGIQIYGKNYVVDNIRITDLGGVGFYSETGTSATVEKWEDMCVGRIDNVWISNCGGHGFHFRGPHDAKIGTLEVAICGQTSGDNVRFETSSNYSGFFTIEFLHSYGCITGHNFYSNSGGVANTIIAESNTSTTYPQVSLQTGNHLISNLYAWNRVGYGGTQYVAVIAGNRAHISNLVVIDFAGSGGVNVTASAAHLANVSITGSSNGTNIVGLNLACTLARISGKVTGFTGTGCKGLKTSGVQGSVLDLTVRNSSTLWENASAGLFNIYNLDLGATSIQTVVTLTAAKDTSEIWNISSWDGTLAGRRNDAVTVTKGVGTQVVTSGTSVTVLGMTKFEPRAFIGKNDVFVLRMFGNRTGSGGNKKIRAFVHTAVVTIHDANTTGRWSLEVVIQNRNSTNSQIVHWIFTDFSTNTISTGSTTTSIDLTALHNVGIDAQCSNGGDTVTSESFYASWNPY